MELYNRGVIIEAFVFGQSYCATLGLLASPVAGPMKFTGIGGSGYHTYCLEIYHRGFVDSSYDLIL